MELLVVAAVAFGAGLLSGLRFAGHQFGRQLKAEMLAGRLSRTDVEPLSNLKDAR